MQLNRKVKLVILCAVVIFGNLIRMIPQLFNVGYAVFAYLSAPIGQFDDYYKALYGNPQMPKYASITGFVNYPLGTIVYNLLSIFPDVDWPGSTPYGLITFTFIGLALFFCALHLYNISLATTLLLILSYPVLFNASRGNNELIVCSLLLISLHFKEIGKVGSASLLFICLNLFEPYPFPLVLWRSPFKTFYKLTRSVTVIILIILFSIIGFNSADDYFQALLHGGGFVTGSNNFSFLFTNSCMGAISIISRIFTGEFIDISTPLWSWVTRIILIGGLATTIIALRIRTVNFADQIILVCGSWCLFVATSPDYRLVHLLLPLALLVEKKDFDSKEICQFVLLLLLIVPKHYIWFKSAKDGLGGTLNSLLGPILLLGLIAVTIRHSPKKQPNDLPLLDMSR